MYWTTNPTSASQIDKLLDKQDVTLFEVLEQEDIIQECKSKNKKLVDFLTRNDILAQLLDLILQEPAEDLEEKVRYKLPNIASELFTCDVNQIIEKLSSDTVLLDKMYGFLDTEGPLNPLLTSFFSKAFGSLFTRRADQNLYSYQFTCVQVINYIKSRPDFIGLILRHVHTSAVMDLLLRLITCVKGAENRTNVLDWLDEEKLIEKIVELFSPRPTSAVTKDSPGEEPMTVETEEDNQDKITEALLKDRDAHDNAGQLLIEIIRGSRDCLMTGSQEERCHNSLLYTAESSSTVELILDAMLKPPVRETVVVNCISVLLALLEIRKPAQLNQTAYAFSTDQDNEPNKAELERQEKVMMQTVETISPRIPEIIGILSNPPHKPAVPTTAGVLDPPLGATRIAVCKLMSALLSTQMPSLNESLIQTPFLTTLLDLFFKYSLNNFLHTQVESCIKSIITWRKPIDLNSTAENQADKPSEDSLQTPKVMLESENPLDTVSSEGDLAENPLLVQLFTDARLLERLVSAWEETASPKTAYMGHVTQMSNHIRTVMTVTEGVPTNLSNRILVNQIFDKLPEELRVKWNELVEGKLSETNKRNEIPPDSETMRNPSSEDDSDFRDIQFPQETALQQMFSDYQIQYMSENFTDTFGYNDDEFNDTEDGLGRGLSKLTPSVNFLMNTDDSTRKAIFQSICENKPSKGFTDSDDEEDIWSERTTELTFGGRTTPDITKARTSEMAENSSDEEENNEDKMDVDNDPWAEFDAPASASASAPIAMETSAPWGEEKEATKEGEGWANFESTQGGSGASGGSWGAGGGDNWADFSNPSSAGGEGFANFASFKDDEKQDDWSPAMSSSPEATMLDEVASSPSLRPVETPAVESKDPSSESGAYQIRRPESPDIANTDANQAPVPSDNLQLSQTQETAAAAVSEPTELKEAVKPEVEKPAEASEEKSEETVEKPQSEAVKESSPAVEVAAEAVESDVAVTATEAKETSDPVETVQTVEQPTESSTESTNVELNVDDSASEA